jgi:hypothetical protein
MRRQTAELLDAFPEFERARLLSVAQADGRAILLAEWPLAEKSHCRGVPHQFAGNFRVFGLFVLRVDLTA